MNIVDELPEDAVQVKSVFDLVTINQTFEDFHKPKYGGTLFIKSALTSYYEFYPFDESVTSKKIIKFIHTEQLYFVENSVSL